mgnify:CR=1 FL=1
MRGARVYEEGALLRSVAVDAEYRGTGLGSDLTRTALDPLPGAAASLPRYLLTTTAERFFPGSVSRSWIAPTCRTACGNQREFAHACPSSALILRKRL